ncbi:MAG: helix-turn-helix transcriptional regulator, partial [Lachnospiraceae bacterium]|nr:helix-turn-helix transcriptional regulator [Lachnospiraceae bacterium]
LVKYVMTVWRELNHKVSTTMVYTYEIFGPDYTRIYLPIVEDKPDHTEDRETIRSWTAYIHDHITEDMSLRGIAEHFNYSEQHFHREFKKHVKMSPSEYIVKCRLYLAAKQIREESGNNTEHIARHFRFKTMRSFKRQFMEEFHVEPEAYHDIPVNMIHLTQYYPETNPEVRFTYDNEPELKVLGKILYTYDKGEMIKEPDIPHLNAYWMQHEYDELRGTIYKCSKDEGDKIAFWNNDNTEERSFFLGPVIDQLADIPEGFRVIHIKPGKYAIFESLLNSDNESLSEVYTLLVRNGIEKWARDNEYQTEKAGRAFIRYKGNKLYLYIPVNG